MNANHSHEISDTSDETLQFISDLIAVSRTAEHMIYREAEIDELWRLLRGTHASAATLAVVMEVHDMLEDSTNAGDAAVRLRGLIANHHP
jgi:hypothetical protein